ncbi:glycosyltransferase family 2 protein [Gottfriedia sp. NPDC057948]|uniref:glycosyltransferase family 2 protein n=1 Tax=Gottfriedia sp. NPDC057948 TaxID=3346287 RepID=UPI0036DBCFEB
MNQPQISVILPIYNVENYIHECLNSLLNQTIGYENLEVIMVNDCSNDRTPLIIDEYAAKYENFKAIHFTENSGAPGKPRNVGIENATGKYTIFLDPDDIVPADAYEKLINVIENSDSDFVMGKMQSFDDETKRRHEHVTFKQYQLQKKYIDVNIDNVPFFYQVKTAIILKLVKTEFLLINKIEFIEGMKNGEDKYYDIQLFSKAKKFSYIPEVIYLYRARNDEKNLSLTQRDIISTVENDVKSALIIKPLLSQEEFRYFQINVFRSIFWKIGDADFKNLTKDQKDYLFNLIKDVVVGYDSEITKEYMEVEEPIISLISSGHIEEALDYNHLLISRRWWFKISKELEKDYKKSSKIRNSNFWKVTSPLRKVIRLVKRVS